MQLLLKTLTSNNNQHKKTFKNCGGTTTLTAVTWQQKTLRLHFAFGVWVFKDRLQRGEGRHKEEGGGEKDNGKTENSTELEYS